MLFKLFMFCRLQNPCLRTENETCAPVFGFRHQLSITENEREFAEAVQNTTISGNIDSPEGGFDALMQIAVCQVYIYLITERIISLSLVAQDFLNYIAFPPF